MTLFCNLVIERLS